MFLGKLRFFIVGNIEATAFKYDTGATGNEPPQFTAALGAARQGFIRDLLELLERMLTLHAFIFVCRHGSEMMIGVGCMYTPTPI